jgi:hypothetical protein
LNARYADFGVRDKTPDRGRKDRGGGHDLSILFISPFPNEKGLRFSYNTSRKKIVLKFAQFVPIAGCHSVKPSFFLKS